MSRPASINLIAENCVAVRMRMLNRVVTNHYDEALRPLGLKVSQLNILVATARLGVARPAILSERLHIDVSTLSRNVDRMKSKGWLETVPDEDGRNHPFRLTPSGEHLLEKAVPAWKSAQKQVERLLGEDVVGAIHQAIERIHHTP